MKKSSPSLISLQKRRVLSRRAVEKRARGVRRNTSLLKRRGYQFSSLKITLPEVLSLGKASWRESAIGVIKKLKDGAADRQIANIQIDFSKVRLLHPCGTLLLIAEIERIFESASCARKLSATYPKNKVVEEMLQYISLLERLGLEPRIDKYVSNDVVSWLFASGHEGDLESIAERLPRILTEGSNKQLRTALLTGMAEAIANSSEHAYKKTEAKNADVGAAGLKKKWWLFARQFDDDVAVVICDLGRGIPGTLEANWKDEVASYWRTMEGVKKQDHKMIQLAFTVGKSSTNKKERGKGLKDILKVVKEQKVGVLSIYSNRGVYAIDNNDDSVYSDDEKNSICGTVVQWKIPIDAFGLEAQNRS